MKTKCGMAIGGWLALAAALAMMEGVAWSAPVPRDLLACGEIAGATDRLACFDRYLVAARAHGVDSDAPAPRASARSARPAPVREVVSTVTSVASSDQGRWTLVLADKSVWQSYDAGGPEPRAGESVHIKRGTLGSYLADIGGRKGVVLKRIR